METRVVADVVCQSKERENYKLIFKTKKRKSPCRLPKAEPKAEYESHVRLLNMQVCEDNGGW
jgi:hypothetical protein